MAFAASLRRAVLDPREQRLVFGRADFQPRTAAVRDPTGRLGEKQAVFGRELRKPALAGVTGQRQEVAVRVIAENREMEPVLTGSPCRGSRRCCSPGGSRSA